MARRKTKATGFGSAGSTSAAGQALEQTGTTRHPEYEAPVAGQDETYDPSPPASTLPSGPSVAESATYRRAARAQARLIQKYALNNETERLEKKHYDFDKKGRITKVNATREEIHQDLKRSRQNVKKTTSRLFGSKRVYAANIAGRVVGPKKLARIDARVTRREQRVSSKAAQIRRDAPAPMTVKESREFAKAAIYAKKHPGPVETATAISEEKAALREMLPESEKTHDIFINPETGRPDRFSNYMPRGQQFVQALTGADPYASAFDPGHIAEVVGSAALMAASGGAGAAARAPAVAKAAQRVTAAERATAVPGFVSKAGGARTVGTGAELTGEVGAATTRASRLAARARARYGAPARGARRARRGENLTLKAINPIVPAASASNTGRALIEGHLEAITEEPGETFDTTKRAIYALPAAMISPFIDVATGHGEEALESIADYASQYGQLFSGDPDVVRETVASELGLVPAITGVLGGTAIGRAVGAKPPRLTQSKVDRLANTAAYGKTPKIRDEARRQLENVTNLREPLTSAHGGRKRGAERGAIAAEMETGQAARESRQGGKRLLGVGPRQALEDAIGELNTKKITEHATQGDAVRFLSAHGIRADTKDVMGKLQRIRDDLRDPSKEISKETGTTRAVLDALLAHPEVLKNKKLLAVLDREGVKAYGRSVERHSERTGKRQTTPDPLDEPVRYQSIYRAEGIPQPHERAPSGYQGELTAKPGQNMEKAIVEEARAMNAEAKTKKKQARAEELKAQGAKKELNARRIADDRRVATRTKNAKVRRLEKRLAAWESKLKKAKKPETRKRYAAKVKDLERQIRETKATLALAASPKRLETIRRIAEHTARARTLRAEAKALNEQARANLASTHRAQMRKANQLEVAAEGLRAKGNDIRAAILTDQANKIRAAVEADRARIRDEAQAEVIAAQKREGYAEPAHQKEVDISDRGSPSVAAQRFVGAKAGKKERFREGVLAEEGRIDESALTLLVNSRQTRASMAERWRQRDFIEDEAHVVKGRRFFHQGERTRMQEQGKVPAGYEWVAVQEFVQGIQRSDKLSAELSQARARAIATAPKGSRKIYMLARRSAIKQHAAQMEPLGPVWRGIRAASRLQTIGMLATSTAWFFMQFPATLLVMAARNPNPVAWARSIRRMINTYRTLEPWERTNLNAHFAGNPADFLAVGENVRGIRPNTVAAMDRSMQIALGSTTGKILHAVWDNLRHGGPLIAFNRRYESFQRKFMGMLEMDRLASVGPKGRIRVEARPREFIGSVAKANHLVHEDIKALKGKSYAEQTRYYLENPKRMKVIEKAVNDAYGNWAALTAAEKRLASVVVFYPFVRFSLRWMFWSFPKNNPIKAAIYLNMSQKNAQELQEFLGGPPSFFSDFGKIVAHTGPGGTAEPVLNLSRIAPGGNALIEGLGGSEGLNLQSVLRPVQPIAGITTAALSGKDQFGRDVPEGTSGLTTFAKGVASLNPLSRSLLGPKIAPPSEWSQLFRAVSGRETGPLGALVPDVLSDPEADKEAARLGRMLETASNAPTSAEVKAARTDPSVSLEEQQQMAYEYQRGKDLWAKLNGYLVAYGIKTAAEIKAADEAFEESSKSGYRFLANAAGERKKTKRDPEGYKGQALPGEEGGGYKDVELPGDVGGGGKRKKTKSQLPIGVTSAINVGEEAVAEAIKLSKQSSKKTSTPPDTSLDLPASTTTAIAAANKAVEDALAIAAKSKTQGTGALTSAAAKGLLAVDRAIELSKRPEIAKIQGKEEKRVAKQLIKAVIRSQPTVAKMAAVAQDYGTTPEKATAFAQAALKYGKQYDVPPSILMGVAEIETSFGSNLGPSSAGAGGNMQWMPDTRTMYLSQGLLPKGVDPFGPNGDPLDSSPAAIDMAVHAAAIYLQRGGGAADVDSALYSYNHADWYVEEVKANAQKYAALDQAQTAKPKAIPKSLRLKAQEVLGAEATQKLLKSETLAAAPPKPHLVKGFMKGVEISEGLPTAADLGVKDDSVVLGNIHPELQKALIKLGEQTGTKPVINEGFRTESYQAFLAGTVSGPVAAPGQSHHESGLAVDVDNWGDYSAEELANAGLVQYVGPSDPEHFELVSQPQALVGPMAGTAAAGSTSSGGYVPSTGGGSTLVSTPGGTVAPGVPALEKKGKGAKKFGQGQLLKAIGRDQGFLELFGGAAPAGTAEADATMAAMAEIAATRKRLLKR